MRPERPFTLDRFQEEAIAAIDAGQSVLVAAPTSSGKTVVAEHAVEMALTAGRRAFYTAPIKALSNQKYRDYCALFGEENVGLVTGDPLRLVRPTDYQGNACEDVNFDSTRDKPNLVYPRIAEDAMSMMQDMVGIAAQEKTFEGVACTVCQSWPRVVSRTG